MQKPTIILIEEMRQEVIGIANKYLRDIPAVTMADFFNSMGNNFGEIAKQQLSQAKEQYEQSLADEKEQSINEKDVTKE